MTSSKTQRKETFKELYHEMRQKIRIIIQLLGKSEPDKANPLPEGNSFHTISNLINNIVKSIQIEDKNQYKDAIVEIADWLNAAFSKEYLTKNSSCYPNPVFAIKKGAEILHSFFHRDLRRKQLSSEEHEIYRSYMVLINNLPDPRKNKLSENQIDNRIDDLLKSS